MWRVAEEFTTNVRLKALNLSTRLKGNVGGRSGLRGLPIPADKLIREKHWQRAALSKEVYLTPYLLVTSKSTQVPSGVLWSCVSADLRLEGVALYFLYARLSEKEQSANRLVSRVNTSTTLNSLLCTARKNFRLLFEGRHDRYVTEVCNRKSPCYFELTVQLHERFYSLLFDRPKHQLCAP